MNCSQNTVLVNAAVLHMSMIEARQLHFLVQRSRLRPTCTMCTRVVHPGLLRHFRSHLSFPLRYLMGVMKKMHLVGKKAKQQVPHTRSHRTKALMMRPGQVSFSSSALFSSPLPPSSSSPAAPQHTASTSSAPVPPRPAVPSCRASSFKSSTLNPFSAAFVVTRTRVKVRRETLRHATLVKCTRDFYPQSVRITSTFLIPYSSCIKLPPSSFLFHPSPSLLLLLSSVPPSSFFLPPS